MLIGGAELFGAQGRHNDFRRECAAARRPQIVVHFGKDCRVQFARAARSDNRPGPAATLEFKSVNYRLIDGQAVVLSHWTERNSRIYRRYFFKPVTPLAAKSPMPSHAWRTPCRNSTAQHTVRFSRGVGHR